MTRRRMAMTLLLTPPVLLRADLGELKAEPDLLKRFERSLEYADAQLKLARQLVRDGGSRADLLKALEEGPAAAALALSALRDTGRKASKLTKQYKKGELRTRELERELGDLALALSIEDRSAAEKARDLVSTTHEEFLLGVMSGR
jgi:hypothetical protein